MTMTQEVDEAVVQACRDNMEPGYCDTYQMCILEKGDKRALRVKAIAEGQNLKEPFPLEFLSHPGLAMHKGPDIHGCGNLLVIGEADDDKVMKFTVEKARKNHGGENPEQREMREKFNKALNEAKTPEDRSSLAELITEFGYKNTG